MKKVHDGLGNEIRIGDIVFAKTPFDFRRVKDICVATDYDNDTVFLRLEGYPEPTPSQCCEIIHDENDFDSTRWADRKKFCGFDGLAEWNRFMNLQQKEEQVDGTLVTIDPTALTRNQTFALMGMLQRDPDRYDANMGVITRHISSLAFRWAREAERDGDMEQLEFIENTCLPSDYRSPGIWYDASGFRYDRNECTVTDTEGNVSFDPLAWLDADRERWVLVERAARLASLDVRDHDIGSIATALSILSQDFGQNASVAYDRPDRDYWRLFIIEFAGENYKDGQRTW